MFSTLKQYASWYSIKLLVLDSMFTLIYYVNLAWTFLVTLFTSNLESSVLFVKDNHIIDTSEDAEFLVKIYTNNQKTLIKVINDINCENYENYEKCKELECCNYNFILVLLKLSTKDDENYNIDITSILKNNKISYYVSNAILFDKSFYDWLSIRHLNNKLVLGNTINIQGVDIIDQYAEHISITNKQFIKLNKNEYSICDHK
jgi:hypothetical protein